MAGRRIGEVFVAVEADTSLFRASATAGLKKALFGLEGKIPITADTSAARAQVAALKARMTDLSRVLSEIKIGANGKPAEAEIRKLQLQLANLAQMTAHVTMAADTSKLDADIAREELKLAKLNEEASSLSMDADNKRLIAKIATGEYAVERLEKRLEKLKVGVDDTAISAFLAQIHSIEADLEVLVADAHNIVLDADASRLLTAIGRSEAAIAEMRAQAEDLKIGGKVDLANLANIELSLLGLEGAVKRLNPDLAVMNDKLVQGARGWGRFGIGALAARVALFGGLSAVSGWHIALDAIIESLAVIVPALTVLGAGLAAFALAGSDAFRQVYQRLQNIHTVADAFGVTIGPMTGALEKLHAVVRPQVWQLYGDAIAVAHNKTGLFAKLAVDTGGVIDKLAARITVLATSAGPGLDRFIAAGTRDLQQFGRIFLNLGDAFGKLIQVTQQTHIADTLLAIVNAGAKLFDLFTKIPIPILATVIAIHGIYLWSGLAATGMVALLRPFSRMAAAAAGAKAAGTAVQDLANAGGGTRFARLGAVFKDLGTNLQALPGRVKSLATAFKDLVTKNWQAVVAGVVIAGLITIGIWLSRTKSRAQELLGQIDQLGRAATVFNVFNNLGAQLILTNRGLAIAQKDLNARLKEGTGASAEFTARFGPMNAGASEAADRVSALTARHQELVSTLLTTTTRLSGISKAYGTQGLAGAIALANIAGVKIDQLLSKDKAVWAGALQQIDGVVQGYQNMGQGATQLANDINVLTIAQSDQLKNVQTLNSAFDQFTQIVSGPIDSFLSLANTLKRFTTDAGVAGASISGLGTGFTATSRKVTDASLQLQSDFQDTFKAATQMADAMRLTGTASDKQVAAIKEVVQVLIPLAGSNKAAAAEISSLAQEAGGPATTNLKSLATWAGKTKDPLGQAQKAADNAAIGFSNMSLDAQKLGTTLSQDLTKDMATAVETAVGLQGAMNQFAKDLQKGTDVTAAGHKDRAKLYADLAAVGITGKQADAIIKALTDRLTGHRKELEASQKARALFNQDLRTVLDRAPGSAKDVQALADAVKNHGDKSDAAKGARQRLIQDLEKSGVDAHTAKGLVDGLQRSISGMHGKTVQVGVNFNGTGHGNIAFKETIPGVTLGPSSQGLLGFHAEGGMITGGRLGKDSVLGMLMPGEVVVPTKMVQEGAVDHLRGRLPGFAGGGAVSGPAGVDHVIATGNRMFSSGAAFMEKTEVQFGKAVEQAFFKAVLKKFENDMNALGGGGPAIVRYARSFLGKIPYVFGGNSLSSGIDCSGFTQQVYGHFGIRAPRTSEAQFSWVTPSAAVPGALAFYVSPAGGPPPGHVAIVQDGNSVISQGGGLGPRIESLRFLPLMGTGVPKGGFPASAGGAGNQSIGGSFPGTLSAPAIESYWTHAGGPGGQTANIAQAITAPESGRRPSAVQQGQPYATTGWGLWQITPGNSEPQAGVDAALLNPANNAIAAVAKYNQAGGSFRPWTTYVNGLYLPYLLASGGLIPGYAGGGVTGLQSKLKSLQAHEGQDYTGLRQAFFHGPKKYMNKSTLAALHSMYLAQGAEQTAYKPLLTASKVNDTNLAKLAAAATKESATLKATTKVLGRKAGGHPGWIAGLSHWLGQLSSIGKAGLTPFLPGITHTYGGDVGDTIGTFLSSVASPFGAAGGGMVFDRGGWLKPGWNIAYNNTGKNEHLVPADQDIRVQIDVSGANSDAEKFLATMIKKYVKVRGGNVQKVYGSH